MKRVTAIVAAILLVAGCTKPQYQKVIESYLQENLHDPKSYENVEMGTPGKVTYMTIFVKYANEVVKSGRMSALEAHSADRMTAYRDSLAKDGIDAYETLFWEVEHTYKAKNQFGATVLKNVVYTLNPDMTKILRVEDK